MTPALPPSSPLAIRPGHTTLSKFVISQLADSQDHGQLAALLIDVAAAVKAISAMTAKGALGGYLGSAETENVQGETQKKLDILTNDAVIDHCQWGGQVAGMASEEMDDPYVLPKEFARGPYLLVFDPLDGSSNIDVNVSVGTIFSVLKNPKGEPGLASYLQNGCQQVAAGYAIYGPSTMLVLSLGKGTHGFTLDREIGNFVLTHPNLMIPTETKEFAINASNERFWEAPVQRYISELKAGKTGARGEDFNTRWVASMVADVHRILMRGGIYLYPLDSKTQSKGGRLRLLYEANPMAMLIEQAGGRASTGRERIMDVKPTDLHQRIPVIVGSASEVERVESYYQAFLNGTDQAYESPLFNERSLYRDVQ